MTDKYHAHEALDRCSMLTNVLSDYLYDHPYIQDRPQFAGEVQKAIEILADLYQQIGAAEL